MFQDPYASLDPRMRVGRILREPLAIQHLGTRAEQGESVLTLLADVGLPDQAVDRYAHEFSGGQRQRIGLARALALNPKLVVADEPVSALDVSIRSQVLNLMKRLQSEHDLTYIVISHDLAVVKYLADTIGVMYLGKIVEIGPSEAIYEQPAHPYTARLIEAIPLPSPELERSKNGTVVRGELPSAIDPPSGCRFRTRCDRATELCAEQSRRCGCSVRDTKRRVTFRCKKLRFRLVRLGQIRQPLTRTHNRREAHQVVCFASMN